MPILTAAGLDERWIQVPPPSSPSHLTTHRYVKVDHEGPSLIEKRRGYWLHVDGGSAHSTAISRPWPTMPHDAGALGASFVPYLHKAHSTGQLEVPR